MKQADISSIDQGGGKRRVSVMIRNFPIGQSSKRQCCCLVLRNSRVPNTFERWGPRERPMSEKRKAANECAQCGFLIIAPEWSEYLSERCARHLWSCELCGYQFESSVYFPVSELAVDLQAA
jgi:ribosomal protein L37AE/L43A